MHGLRRYKATIPSPAKTEEPGSFNSYVIVAAGFLILLTVFGAQFSFGVFFKPVLAEFGWTRAITSGAYSLNTILSGFLAIIAGRLTDRLGSRLVITVGGVCFGLGYLLMSRVTTVWQIYVFYGVLTGIGAACIWVPLMSSVSRWFVKRKVLMSGIISSGVSVGVVAMPLLANHLIATYSWRTSYLIIGLAVLAVCTIAAQFLKGKPTQTIQPGSSSSEVKEGTKPVYLGLSVEEALRTRRFWMLSALFLLFGFCMNVVFVHLVPHATDAGVSPAAAALLLSIIGGVSIAGRLGLGNIGDKLGGRRTLIITLIFLSVAFFWLLFTSELWALYVFAVIFAVGYGAMSAIMAPIVDEFFGLVSHGAIFGFIFLAMNIGGAIGPLVAGRLFDTAGSYYWAFVICVAASVAGLVISSLLKPTREQH
jgi:MFS family permease